MGEWICRQIQVSSSDPEAEHPRATNIIRPTINTELAQQVIDVLMSIPTFDMDLLSRSYREEIRHLDLTKSGPKPGDPPGRV